MLPEHGGVGLRAALEGDLRQLDAGHPGDLLHADMQRGAGARRGIGHLAGVRLGELHHVLPALELRLCAGGHTEGVAREMDDVGEVLGRIPRHVLHQGQAEHGDRNLRDGVPVRLRRGCHGRRSNRAAAAGLVVDHDRLTQHLRGAVGDGAHRDVGRSAGRPRHDQCDRLAGIVLRTGGRREQRARDSHGGKCDRLQPISRHRKSSLGASSGPPFFVLVRGLFPKSREKKSALREPRAAVGAAIPAETARCDNWSFGRVPRGGICGSRRRYATRRTMFSVSMVRSTSAAGQGLPK